MDCLVCFKFNEALQHKVLMGFCLRQLEQIRSCIIKVFPFKNVLASEQGMSFEFSVNILDPSLLRKYLGI